MNAHKESLRSHAPAASSWARLCNLIQGSLSRLRSPRGAGAGAGKTRGILVLPREPAVPASRMDV